MGARKKEFRFFPEHPCKMCDKMIPEPSLYCSSECMRKDKKSKLKTNVGKKEKRGSGVEKGDRKAVG